MQPGPSKVKILSFIPESSSFLFSFVLMCFYTNLVLVLVQFHGGSMSKKQVMGYNVGFSSRVTVAAIFGILGTSSGCKSTSSVPIETYSIWLVHCDPVLDSITKSFEAKFAKST
jgi:hypothetical protein